jgi:Sec-independent protein translocase protein TatA
MGELTPWHWLIVITIAVLLFGALGGTGCPNSR